MSRKDIQNRAHFGGRRLTPVDPRGGLAPIDQILKRWVKANKVSVRLQDERLLSVWAQVVGKDIAERTRVVDASRGELLVEVDSAPLLNELSTYYCGEILESLRQFKEFGDIYKLRFRTGSF